MDDRDKSKEQLLDEIVALRRQVGEIQALGSSPLANQAYLTLAANIPGIVYRVLIRENGGMVFFNDMLTRMTGYTENELTPGVVSRIDALVLIEDREARVSEIRRAITENRPFEVSFRIRDKQGVTRWFSEYGAPICGADGSPEFIDGIILDNTRQQKAAEMMRETNERFEALLNATTDVALLIDLSGQLLALNRTFARRLGSTVKGLLGKCVWDHVPHDVAERGKQRLERAVADRVQIREEETSGDDIFDESVYPVFDANGDVKALAVFARKITKEKRAIEALREAHEELELRVDERTAELMALNEQLRWEIVKRKKSEEAVRESEERFRRLVELSPYGTGIARNGIAEFVNNAVVKMLGAKDPEEIVGRPIVEFVHPDYRSLAVEHMRRVVQDREVVYAPDQKLVRMDGGIVDVEVTAVPFTYMGRPAVHAVFNDVTEQKRAKEQIETSLKEKELLLREIHHRVKNNLQVISSLLRLQSRNIDLKAYRDMFDESQNRLQVMALIHEKLYQSPNLRGIEFCSYLRALAAHLFGCFGNCNNRIEFKIKSTDIQLEVDTAAACGLIANELISNSLKHAFPGGRKGLIEVSLAERGRHFEFVVSDNGTGMGAPVDLENDATLGLRLVGTMVKQLRGEMTLESGNGATFVLTFPGARVDAM